MKYRMMQVKVTLLEDILGTESANPEIHREYIAANAPTPEKTEEEVQAVEEAVMTEMEYLAEKEFEKKMTIFPRDEEGKPFLWDYQVRGFFKDACSSLRSVTGSECSKVKAYKKAIDGLIFVEPRKIPFDFDGEVTICQRPLRGNTPKGERVALASSESVPAGATITFTIKLLCPEHRKMMVEMLNYGKLRGLGQWRNSGKGRFSYEILKEWDEEE